MIIESLIRPPIFISLVTQRPGNFQAREVRSILHPSSLHRQQIASEGTFMVLELEAQMINYGVRLGTEPAGETG